MPRDPRRRLPSWIAFLLLLVFAVQGGIAAVRDSTTIDELAHLPLGLYFLRHREFSPDPINPPLSRMLPALALIGSDVRLDAPAVPDEWQLGLRFMRDNVDRYQELYARSRAVVILLSLLLGLIVYRWSLALHGEIAALIALAFFAFSPTLLAHGHLVTVDMAGALGFAAGLWQVWQYRQERSTVRAMWLGAFVGLALLLKFSCLPLVVVAAIALLLPAGSWPRSVGRTLIAAATAILVIDLGYGFQDLLQPLSNMPLIEGGGLAKLAADHPALAFPLPTAFIRGFDLLASAAVKGDRSYYLAGEISNQGWWYYHFVAYALKTPLPFLIAALFAMVRYAGRRSAPGEGVLWIGVAAVFLFGGVLNPLKLGVRHVMPAEPLLCILAAGALAKYVERALGVGGSRSPGDLVGATIVSLALAWHAASALAQAPRYISYFNELAGGPERGHEWLSDSNLDWGQDLIRLREFMDERGLETIELAYCGTVHPGAYGIRFLPLSDRASSGVKVVSPLFYVGLPYQSWRSPDAWSTVRPNELHWLHSLSPSERVGALFVFTPERSGR